jgi:hypothetical protein
MKYQVNGKDICFDTTREADTSSNHLITISKTPVFQVVLKQSWKPVKTIPQIKKLKKSKKYLNKFKKTGA